MQLTSDRLNPSLKIFLTSLVLLSVCAGYAGLWSYLWGLSHAYWFLPAGLRFVALMYTRRAYWPVLILGEWLAIVHLGIVNFDGGSILESSLAGFTPSAIYAAVIGLWLSRRDWTNRRIFNQGELVHVALAVIVAGMFTATSLFMLMPADSPFLIFEKFSIKGVFSYALGDIAGVLFIWSSVEFIKSLLVMSRPIRLVFFRNATLLVFPITAVIALLLPRFEWAFLALMFLPIVFLGLKHGWPGATFSLMALNIITGLIFWLSGNTVVLFDAQVFLVSVGFTGLFLGAAVSQQRELTEDIRKISQRMIATQETERGRISKDLHDHIGQVLTALTLRIAIIKQRVPAEFEPEFELLDKLAAQVFHDVHEIVEELSPREFTHFGLKRSLEGPTIRKMLKTTNVTYTTSIDESISAVPEPLQLAIFRISQEALSNIAKHSQATVCSLKIAFLQGAESRMVRLDILDNGTGFDTAAVSNGHGLQNIKDRVHAHLGDCVFSSGEAGTRLKVTLPL